MPTSKRTMKDAAMLHEINSLREKDPRLFEGLVSACGGDREAVTLLLESGLSRAQLQSAYSRLCLNDAAELHKLLKRQSEDIGFSIKQELLGDLRHLVHLRSNKIGIRRASSPSESDESVFAELAGESYISSWVIKKLVDGDGLEIVNRLQDAQIRGQSIARLFAACAQNLPTLRNEIVAELAEEHLKNFDKMTDAFGYDNILNSIHATERVLEFAFMQGKGEVDDVLSSGLWFEDIAYAYDDLFEASAEKTFNAIKEGRLLEEITISAHARISELAKGDAAVEEMLSRLLDDCGVRAVYLATMTSANLEKLSKEQSVTGSTNALYDRLKRALPKIVEK